MLQGTMRAGVQAKLISVLVHRGIKDNEILDRSKNATRKEQISMDVIYSEDEMKSIVGLEIKRKCHKHWYRE